MAKWILQRAVAGTVRNADVREQFGVDTYCAASAIQRLRYRGLIAPVGTPGVNGALRYEATEAGRSYLRDGPPPRRYGGGKPRKQYEDGYGSEPTPELARIWR